MIYILITAYILNNKADLCPRDPFLELIVFLINSAFLIVKKLLHNLGRYNSEQRIVINKLMNMRNGRLINIVVNK